MAQATLIGLKQRPGVQQFVKFCVIGLSSLLIDVVVSFSLVLGLHTEWHLAKTISFIVSVTNGYYWNSKWTFKGMGSGKRHEQYMKFVAVNIVGYILNMLIMQSVFALFYGRFFHQPKPEIFPLIVATGTAVVCVSTWNFLANKLWTFKHPAPETILEK